MHFPPLPALLTGLLFLSPLAGVATDPDPAFAALLAKAQAGDARAEVDLSLAYFQGKGVAQDYQKAYDWSLESAIQGNANAEGNIGFFYEKGQIVHQNQAKTFAWYLKAAQDGSAEYQRAVGVRYIYGMGTARNPQAGIPWLRKAAIQGEHEAQSRLGYALMNGYGCDVDLEQGFAYLMESCGSYIYSRFAIANCYANGLYVTRDPVRAYAWILITPLVQKDVQDLTDKLKKELTSDQIKEATELSSRLLAQITDGDFQSATMQALLDKGSSLTLKFDYWLGYIILPLTLQNKEQLDFIVDTGCSISLLDAKIASRFNLTGKDFLPLSGIGAHLETSTIADDVSLRGSGLTITGARVAIWPHFDLDQYMGRPLAGIIGTDILKHFVVRIDYAKKTLTLALPGQLPEDSKAVSIPMDVTRNFPSIKASVSSDSSAGSTGTFLIDTGDSGATSLTKFFQESNPAVNIHQAVQSGALGLGGIEKTGTGRATVSLGGFHFANSLVVLSQNRQGNLYWINGGDIGAEIWSRFITTLDFPEHKLYLQPSARFDHPFDYPYGGVGIKTTGGDYKTFVIYHVIPDSPASSIGLRIGDVLVQVDKRPTNTMTMEDFFDRLTKEGTYEVQIRRDGKDLTFKLPVFDPFKHPDQIALYKDKASTDAVATKIQSFAVQYVSGAPIYPDDVIIRASGLKIDDAYLPFTSNRALKKLYATGLFENVGLSSEAVPGGVKVTITLQPNPIVKMIAITGLSSEEQAQIGPQMITEEGKRTSKLDLAQDVDLIQRTLGKNNPAERTVSIDITGDDGSKRHQDIVIPKAGA